jgi:hypothetical protein
MSRNDIYNIVQRHIRNIGLQIIHNIERNNESNKHNPLEKINIVCNSNITNDTSFDENYGHNCAICFDGNECNKDSYIKTNCDHYICFECIKTWVEFSQKYKKMLNCPLCRTSIVCLNVHNEVISEQLKRLKR